jgi:hypothetical protein
MLMKAEQTRRLVTVAVTALALSAAIAVSGKNAEAGDYARSGYWTNYYEPKSTSGQAVCGMRTGTASNMSIHVKWFAGVKGIAIQTFKGNWRIPKGQKVKVNVGFDKTQVGTATATGDMIYGNTFQMGMLSFTIDTSFDDIKEFLSEFMAANKMWVEFPEGSEKPWFIDMTGSRDAANAFFKCIQAVPVPTQPYGSPEVSQPYGKQPAPAPTQPFDRKPSIQEPVQERGA